MRLSFGVCNFIFYYVFDVILCCELLLCFGKNWVVRVVMIVREINSELISVIIMLMVIGLIKLLMFLFKRKMGIKFKMVVSVEVSSGINRCEMFLVIVFICVKLGFCKLMWILLVIIMVLLISKLMVMIMLKIDIWWICLL